MKKITIIGFGRFGKVLYQLVKHDFDVTIFYRRPGALRGVKIAPSTKTTRKLDEAYQSDVVFLAVPISQFEKVLQDHRQYWRKHLLVDVLSVKMHPARLFEKYLRGTEARAMLTHPMFGPDSAKAGFRDLPIVLDRLQAKPGEYRFWKNYFSKKGLRVVELTARKHDRLAAYSQGVTHFIGRLLEEMRFQKTPIDTLGAGKLREIEEQTCNDTWELFHDLQTYNPYTREIRLKLGRAYDKVYNKLLPRRVDPSIFVFGIQGGEGSFNEEALLDYVHRHGIKKYRIAYLYTTERVLHHLHAGLIDYGLFAMHNSVGGVVEESIRAIARYKFAIKEEFAIRIRHQLMRRKDNTDKKISVVMAHPQVFAQCQSTLRTKHPDFILKSGKGDMIDTAVAARMLAAGKLPKTIAILGPERLSELYDLKIVGRNFQDDKTNNTSFLLVER